MSMFPMTQGASQIAQGSSVFILNRRELDVINAMVTGVSQPHLSKAAQANPALALQGFVVDLTLSIGGESTTVEFPVNSASANYPDKGWFVSNDKSIIVRELESEVNIADQNLAQRVYFEQRSQKGKAMLLQLDSDKQKEAIQEREIALLKEKLADMEKRSSESNAKLDRMLELLSVSKKPKKEE